MNDIDILEELANNEHIRWSNWQKYVHSKCIKNEDGSLTIPKEYVEHWEYEINTDYDDLPDNIKESDRREVRQILEKLKFSTLIAENKELKEENDSLKKEIIHWKGEYHLENRKYLDLYNKKVSIPKINATEEMLEQYVEKIKIIKDIEELEDYIQHSANPLSIDNSKFAIKILQSLLGKE